ncbi:MAG: hypothetical protein LBI54_10455, partial [Lachnospiraceae bacterium]|nr:hypothetical protein [Lachnospiraceae bacterium]
MVKPDDLKKATQSYLTKEDFDALQTLINGKDWNSQDASRSPHLPWYILSFREAGEATIERLRQGCGAKPHDILAKSIKCPKGTEASYMTSKLKLELSETDAEKTYALIKGFVGYYQVGALKGLYLTDLGSAVF